MRLKEISGNSREEVLARLTRIFSVLRIYKNTLSPDIETINLVNSLLLELDADPVNLNYWLLRDKDINNIYRKIKNMRD